MPLRIEISRKRRRYLLHRIGRMFYLSRSPGYRRRLAVMTILLQHAELPPIIETRTAWDFDRCSLDEITHRFRFSEPEINFIVEKLESSFRDGYIRTSNGMKCPLKISFAIFLHRFAFPSRLLDLATFFGKQIGEISDICNTVAHAVVERFGHLLSLETLSRRMCTLFASKISEMGSPYDHIIGMYPVSTDRYLLVIFTGYYYYNSGFIDGTIRKCCRPVRFQEATYNGWKRAHALKYQAVVCWIWCSANYCNSDRHRCALMECATTSTGPWYLGITTLGYSQSQTCKRGWRISSKKWKCFLPYTAILPTPNHHM